MGPVRPARPPAQHSSGCSLSLGAKWTGGRPPALDLDPGQAAECVKVNRLNRNPSGAKFWRGSTSSQKQQAELKLYPILYAGVKTQAKRISMRAECQWQK